MQIYFVWNYYVYTDWDVASVVGLADKIAHNESTDIYINYFRDIQIIYFWYLSFRR